MTERKPPNVTIRGWIEQQIQRAQREGQFDNLAGQGKPISKMPMTHETWVADKMRRENLSAIAALPPSLALPKEVEDLTGVLAKLRSETAVREHLADLNRRIRAAHLRPQEGPPLLVLQQDVEAHVERWRNR